MSRESWVLWPRLCSDGMPMDADFARGARRVRRFDVTNDLMVDFEPSPITSMLSLLRPPEHNYVQLHLPPVTFTADQRLQRCNPRRKMRIYKRRPR